jgi:hypothetical protein
MSSKAFICSLCTSLIMGLGSAIAPYNASAENENLKLNKDIIENSPVLRRWLVDPPDILYDIYNTPSFGSKFRLGLTSRDGSLGFDIGLRDLFLGKSPFTISANYQSEFSGRETDLNADLRYYILPLGGYFNIAPLIGYRYIDFFGESLSGVDVGIEGILILSPRSADLRLSQSFAAPLSDKETSITTLSSSFALTDRLSISSSIQWRKSPVRSDSRVGFYLEWRL